MVRKGACARAKAAVMPFLLRQPQRRLPVSPPSTASSCFIAVNGGGVVTEARRMYGYPRRLLLSFVSRRYLSEWRDPLRGLSPLTPSSCSYSSLQLPDGDNNYNGCDATHGSRGGDEKEKEEAWSDGWEEEDELESEIGDGGDGGGVVLGDVSWGERALFIANKVLDLHFGGDIRVFAFKVSPRGYIYVRLDKLSNKYGCPSMEEIENFSVLYKQQLEKSGECGEIPLDLALEVSSPGAERILKVPDDLDRFKEMPMTVHYLEEDLESRRQEERYGVLLLESVNMEAGHCVWKLADVRENRDPLGKGKPLGRKQKNWRLALQFGMVNRVTLYLLHL